MRVVAGTARGRRLVAPKGDATRPTSDRVREAVFNALASLDAVRGSHVWDLWCGSGALGIEALSRGAESAVFVDREPAALDAVRANLASSGLAASGRVQRADVLRWVESPDRTERVDLVLADPPYEFDGWAELLARLRTTWLVAESDRELDLGPAFEVVRSRRYGRTWVVIGRQRAVLPTIDATALP